MWVPETDPTTRLRNALVLGVNRAIGTASSLQGDYRFYFDTWGISSHTIGVRYFARLSHKVELRLRERLYTQSSASFYQRNYAATATYMTYDRELSSLWSETVGAKVSYQLSDHLVGEAKVDAFYYHYAEFAPLSGISIVLVTLSVRRVRKLTI